MVHAIEDIKNIKKNAHIPISTIEITDVISSTIDKSANADKMVPNAPIIKYESDLNKHFDILLNPTTDNASI